METLHPRIDFDRERLAAFCEKWKITELQFVGSVVREDFRPDSDIDVMVRFAPDSPFKIWDFEKAEGELREIFGRKTDLIDKAAVEQSKNYIRRRLLLNGDRRYTKDQARLCDLLMLFRRLHEMTVAHTFDEFEQSDTLRYSAAYYVTWIDSMAKRVSSEFKQTNDHIDFERLVGFSSTMVDGHWIDTQKVWNFAKNQAAEYSQLIEPFVPSED